MALDGISSHFLIKELQARLEELRLISISQTAKYDLLLRFSGPGARLSLMISANPSGPFMHIVSDRPANLPQPPNFCMFLRKHLQSGRLLSVRQIPRWERVFVFTFEVRDDLGDLKERRLVVELMGRHSNISLLNEDGVIMDSIRHVSYDVNRYREIAPMRPYIAPPAPDSMSLEEFQCFFSDFQSFRRAIHGEPLEPAADGTIEGAGVQADGFDAAVTEAGCAGFSGDGIDPAVTEDGCAGCSGDPTVTECLSSPRSVSTEKTGDGEISRFEARSSSGRSQESPELQASLKSSNSTISTDSGEMAKLPNLRHNSPNAKEMARSNDAAESDNSPASLQTARSNEAAESDNSLNSKKTARSSEAPESDNSADTENLSLEKAAKILQNNAELKPSRFIVHSITGFSPLTAADIPYRAELDEKTSPLLMSDAELKVFHQALVQFLDEIVEKSKAYDLRSYIYKNSEGKSLDYSAVKQLRYPIVEEYPDLSAAAAKFNSGKAALSDFIRRRDKIQADISNRIKRNANKINLHHDDLEEAAKAGKSQEKGQLIIANLWRFPDFDASKGGTISVQDYYAEDPESIVEIKIKPGYSLQDFAEKCFKRHKKLEAKGKMAKKLLKADREELDFLNSCQAALDRAEELEDLEAVEEDLLWLENNMNRFIKTLQKRSSRKIAENSAKVSPAAKAAMTGKSGKKAAENTVTAGEETLTLEEYKSIINPGQPGKGGRKERLRKEAIRKQKSQKRKKKKKDENESSSGPRRFESPSGFKVEVGRNNLQNDKISCSKAASDDYWFHAKDMPGAHVVLFCRGSRPTDDDLNFCLSLAARYAGSSKIGGDYVEVDYCPAKNLRKPKGAKPGFVTYTGQKTARVKRPSKL